MNEKTESSVLQKRDRDIQDEEDYLPIEYVACNAFISHLLSRTHSLNPSTRLPDVIHGFAVETCTHMVEVSNIGLPALPSLLLLKYGFH